MHPIQDLFLESFHIYYNLICIFICTPICTKFYSCKKWVLQGAGACGVGRSASTKLQGD
jgi:hypothetical protein